MKKYNSPICAIEFLMTSDIISTSSDVYRVFDLFNVGDVDGEESVDRIQWFAK